MGRMQRLERVYKLWHIGNNKVVNLKKEAGSKEVSQIILPFRFVKKCPEKDCDFRSDDNEAIDAHHDVSNLTWNE